MLVLIIQETERNYVAGHKCSGNFPCFLHVKYSVYVSVRQPMEPHCVNTQRMLKYEWSDIYSEATLTNNDVAF